MNTHDAHENPLAVGGRSVSTPLAHVSAFCRTLLATALLLVLCRSAAFAQPQPGPKLDARQIGPIVRQYILDNPEVVLESVRLYQEREQTAQRERSRQAVAAHHRELYEDPASPVLKAANPSHEPVSIVAFVDYRCGYCRKAEETVAKLAAGSDVSVVYKEFPILGAESVLAAQAALAAAKQGAYHKFHSALMTSANPITLQAIEKLATDLGLDAGRLKTDMASPEIDAALTRNHELAGKLGVRSTPTFVIGRELVSGALSAEAFQPLIESARRELNRARTQASGGSL